jgi:alpha-1,2-mannosyltransferase
LTAARAPAETARAIDLPDPFAARPQTRQPGARARGILPALALVLTLLACVQAVHRARQGRSALLKWRPAIEKLWAGEELYGTALEDGREGFPTLPLTAIALTPFLALGDLVGALAWAAFKLVLAWWCVLSVLRLAGGRARDFPPWGVLVVLLLCTRVILSDIAHGNINLPIAAVLVAAALEWRAGRDLRSGLWIGLGAVLKVTPILFLLFFLGKRSPRALAGAGLGIALGAFVLPGLMLGWERNLALAAGWWDQMVAPFLSGAPLGLMQSEHINQSLLGVFARLFSAAVAIPAQAPRFLEDVYVNVLALSPEALRRAHRAAAVAVLAALWWWTAVRRSGRGGARVLGEWSLFALAMLMLSERSWKQHYVTLVLPIAFLAWSALRADAARTERRLAWAALAVAALCFGLSGSGVLGEVGSDMAEAYGVFLWGALALFIACGCLLQRANRSWDESKSPV